MAHFQLPIFGEGETDTIGVDFETADDNLFVSVNGKRTYISLWFHRDSQNRIVVTLGRAEDDDHGGEWIDRNDIPIDPNER